MALKYEYDRPGGHFIVRGDNGKIVGYIAIEGNKLYGYT